MDICDPFGSPATGPAAARSAFPRPFLVIENLDAPDGDGLALFTQICIIAPPVMSPAAGAGTGTAEPAAA
ncbi:hypothetical protein [Streptomyces hiroshimensis]|uniref:Uncharacterized protein n=1 Tax=Streptomyces hiroshimensis TaxID=66424 RepID=A0ABQ2YXK8_9ACTN|nr:hypothetical protein [Streptomyces hiroshimensis]GGX96648.1 hypothetical protein GCM10010324_48300 [Streptomyces hiroshimensis]